MITLAFIRVMMIIPELPRVTCITASLYDATNVAPTYDPTSRFTGF